MITVTDVLAELPALRDWLDELYRDFHAHPELSSAETRTTARIHELLEADGYAVQRIGGGVVGVLRNGDGPTVLLRADIDGLPVTEQTGLAYASTQTALDADGSEVGVMHACGHDVHLTALLGASHLLAATREPWSGTVIALFQPAEETASGAAAMVADGLVDKVPRPDVALGQHVLTYPAGHLGTTVGPVMTIADSIEITLYGTGSHGSMPHLSVDPVVMAASVVQRLQGIVARELPPSASAVVTVGSVHAGTKSNIIADRAVLLVNTRAYSERTRNHLLAAIERIVRAESQASGAPREPDFVYYDQFPLTVNDAEITGRVREAFDARFGAERVFDMSPLPASEDFSHIPDAFGVPYSYWGLGGQPSGAPHHANHSPFFAPVRHPTLETGTEALVVGALAFLDAPRD